ncbi:MAG: PAS domain S-box protein [Syntrophaceae bacterium]|nr:PAS domain S-box protein [Syntrophaceae bacterium]
MKESERIAELNCEISVLRQRIRDLEQSEAGCRRAEEVLRISEAALENVIENCPSAIWISDDKGTMIRMNQACRDLIRVTDEELVGKYNVLEDNIVEQQGAMPLVRSVFEKGETVRFTLQYDSAQLRPIQLGTTTQRVVEVTISPVLDSQGHIIHAIIQHLDITEQTASSQQIRQLSNEQRAVLNTISMGICFAKNRIVQWVNPMFARMFGYELDELWGVDTSIFYADPEDYRRVGKEGYARISKGDIYTTEARMKKKDGTPHILCEITGQALNPRDLEEGSIWVLHDITERKQAEEQLLESEERFRRLANAAQEGIIIQQGGTILEANESACRMFGFELSEAVGRNVLDFLDPKSVTPAVKMLGQEETYVEALGLRKDKTVFPLELFGKTIMLRNGKAWIIAARDLSKQRHAEEALRSSEERFKRLVQNSNDIIAVIDENGVLTSVSESVERILGYQVENLIGVNAFDFIHPDDLQMTRQVLSETVVQKTGTTHWAEFRFRRRDRSWAVMESVATNLLKDPVVRGIVLNVRDVTERKNGEQENQKLQGQLQQAMKMEAVGRLAGGVAHDFNNLLTVITGYLDLARIKLKPPDPLLRSINGIHKAAESAAALTRQLLAFSRRQIIEPKVVNLNDLVGSLVKMLTRLIGEDVALETVLDTKLGSVKVDTGQFEQVLVNLSVNARDAMPDGGRLVIETSNCDLDEEYCSRHPEVRPGKYVLLAVSDTGHGMSDEVKQHLFEPFFTTKSKGQGTGLGLATTFGVVKQAGGTIEAYSELGRGSTFKIYLPRVEERAERLVKEAPDRKTARGSETVLLVEDDESVRDMALNILEHLGYNVLTAANGGEALLLMEKQGDDIDMLMTDVVMPGMNGRELAERLIGIKPELKVLFTSGYTENVIVHHGILDSNLNFIGKPYSLQALARKMREVLGPGKT